MRAGTWGSTAATRLARGALVAALYFAAVVISSRISPAFGRVSPIRLPNGVAVTALLLLPPGDWWIVFVALLPVNVVGTTGGWSIGAQYYLANALHWLVAASILRRFTGESRELDGLQPCVAFIVGAVLLGPAVGASAGAHAIVQRQPDVPLFVAWRLWFLADAVGNLTVVPTLLAVRALARRGSAPVKPWRIVEMTAIGAAVLIPAAPAFSAGVGFPGSTAISLVYTPFPALVWAGLRFGSAGAAGANLLLIATSLVSALSGRGPFAPAANPAGELMLQQFLIVAASTVVTLGGIADERRRAIAGLRLSRELFSLAFQRSPDAVTISKVSTGELLEVNDGFVRMTGVPRDEAIGRTTVALGIWPTPEDRDRIVDAVRSGSCSDIEARIRARSGQLRTALFSASRLGDGDNDLMVSVSRDVTEARLRDAALRDSEGRYLGLFNAATDVVLTTDLAGAITSTNHAFETTTGWTSDDLAGHTAFEFLHPDDVARARSALAAVAAGTPRNMLEWRVRTKDGGWRVGEIRASIFLREGRPAGFLLIGRDVTERKAAEAERVRLEAHVALTERLETVGQLAGGVAHDFNNILQAIVGFAGMASDELPAKSPAWRSLQGILDAAERARALTRQLLTFSRRDSSSPSALTVGEVAAGVGQMMRRVLPANISLHIHTGGAATTVMADRGHVEQVLMNLCVNARDAMPDGGRIGVTVEPVHLDDAFAAAHAWARAGDFVQIAVSDTGTGIPRDVLPHIFEPFFTTKGIGQGTGLGLSNVYAIVKRYDGLLDVETAPGQGTTFRIFLPRTLDASAERASAASDATPPGHGELILVAEDEAEVREIARTFLERAGYRVVAAGEGAALLALFERHRSEIAGAFLDLMMPGLNGLELAERMRRERPDLPVAFASGYADRPFLGAAADALPGVLLDKPYSRASLLQTVHELVSRGREKAK